MKQIIYFSFILVTLVSCEKEYGCTDEAAVNFYPKAEINDNSCYYELSGVLYWQKNLCFFQDIGVSELSISIDGKFVAENIDLTTFYPCEPGIIGEFYDCENNEMGFPSFHVQTSTYASSIFVEVFDEDQSVIKSFVVNVKNETFVDLNLTNETLVDCNSLLIDF